jgi:hypothetical protein
MDRFDEIAFKVTLANTDVIWAAGVMAALTIGEREGARAALMEVATKKLIGANRSLNEVVEGIVAE